MNFSELFKQTSHLCRFSPDANYLANIVQFRLIIREVRTLQIVHLYTCLDKVQHIQWSSDSQFILCGLCKRGIVQVWSLEQPEWTCKIDEGSAGLTAACWSPDGRHILTTADFQLRITVWSLVTKSVSYIKYPKKCQQALDFTRNGQYMALAERRDCKDFVSIFACSNWQLLKHFETNTDDLAGVSWSPDGRVLCVWESCLKYKVVLYTVDGQCLSSYHAYDYALGIKSVAWSPTSQFLALGSFDEKLRILNHITWKSVAEHSHPPLLDNPAIVVYREVEMRPNAARSAHMSPTLSSMYNSQTKYEVVEGQVSVPIIKPDLNKANPKIGVSKVAFSANGRYIFTINDNMPHALWIWDIKNLAQTVLLQQLAPIKGAEWDPVETRLALCTANNKVYVWSPAGSLSVEVPGESSFQVTGLSWQKDGKSILLLGKDSMCFCFFTSCDSM